MLVGTENLLNCKNGDIRFLRSAKNLLSFYVDSSQRRPQLTLPSLWKSQISESSAIFVIFCGGN